MSSTPCAPELPPARLAVLFALAVLAALLLGYGVYIKPGQRLLLAPMIGQLEHCVAGAKLPAGLAIDPAFAACNSEAGSAAAVIESTLSRLGPSVSANGHFELGYTLNVPLLNYLVPKDGDWVINQAALDRAIKTIAQSGRPVILYLFSNHFSAFAPIEPVLAADPANLAVTPAGLLGVDKHYGMDVYPWSVARTDNSLTQARVRVVKAVVDALCAQPAPVRARLAGITVLGEVHQLFPGFEDGMGFTQRYLVSDYSARSVEDFRVFLQARFKTISALNAALGGAEFASFDAVAPPSKNIRLDKLKNYWEHIDSFARGSLPVQGWLAPDPRLSGAVKIYVDGVPVARARTGLGRQDVFDHIPALGTADVGWRHDIDFRALAPGLHEVVALADARQGPPVLLGRRSIAVVDRQQNPVARVAQQALPTYVELKAMQAIQAAMDQPADHADYYYNPLAELWAEFRGLQVVRYQQFVEQPVANSCLNQVPRYVHQLFPYPNPSWDASKYAVDQSLDDTGDMRLGVSLYGEATYGDSFFGWKREHRRGPYGITEFHPLRAMDATEFRSVLEHHRLEGAQFLSFFLEGRGPVNKPYVDQGVTIPFLGEANRQNGSDKLYRGLRELWQRP